MSTARKSKSHDAKDNHDVGKAVSPDGGQARPQKAGSAHFGLITEADFFRPELHGFEVDMAGSVVVPELRPLSDK
ncbi:MAG TPA: hypothetical protein VNO70_03805 [Blastocatellia bacterium]|nr:hypothetical protein [Blastocatellia bacterium]